MKIICIGGNYSNHIEKKIKENSKNPVFFFKPDTALLRNNEDFYIPNFTSEINCEIELVVKIDRIVKSIDKNFANRCYSEIGLGIDFTAKDIQRHCISNGLPWEISKAFDKSSPISKVFIPLNDLGGDVNNIEFSLNVNGELRQIGNTCDMLFDIDRIIEYISSFVTLKIGDLIYTGTPNGGGIINSGDYLEGYLGGDKLLDFQIK